MTDRELILARVRAALAGAPPPEAAPAPAGHERPRAGELAGLFARRCGEYRATVTRCRAEPAEIRAAVAAACARQGVRTLLIPGDVDRAWLPDELPASVDDPPLSLEELDGCDAALTACAGAIAQTGTIVLDGGPGQGRRALSLIPDVHVCVVDAGRIVADLFAAIETMSAAARRGRPLTMISGPSATSDIELVRVEGVHGPRRLEVVVAG